MVRPFPRKRFQNALLRWYDTHGRGLPWRNTRDPYAIAVSEVMLQQTQVDRVRPKYQAWLRRFPTLQSLAAAPLPAVLRLWSGLGYNSRAMRLRLMARVVISQHGGRMPDQLDQLQALPGFGPYTAGAVATFAFDRVVPVIDTNIRRVLGRIFFGPGGAPSEGELLPLVNDVIPVARPGDWNHALMDLGATICISGRPRCEMCPLRSWCRAYPAILSEPPKPPRATAPKFHDSDRYWRGRIIQSLVHAGPGSLVEVRQRLQLLGPIPMARLRAIITTLEHEGLLVTRGKKWRVAA